MPSRSSSSKPRSVRHAPVGYRDIVAELRDAILSGKFIAGQRLPTQVELQKRFRTTPVTVQRAIQELAGDGFIRTRGGSGVFVADHPTHLYDYALVFPHDPANPPGIWSRYYAALVNEAAAFSQRGDRRVMPFYGMDYVPQAPDYPRLVKRVESYRLAGIIFATAPFRLADTPVLNQPGIPRVAVMSEPTYPNVPAVWFESYLPKALDRLAARGRKRIALLGNFAANAKKLQPLLSARNMRMRPSWAMPLYPPAVEGARVFVQLLMEGQERPDALIIGDDNLIEPAVAGLIAAGVRTEEELDVVAHCFFPWAGPTILPMERIGYDARAVLRTCIELIDRQRRAESVPPVTKIAAAFEEELSAVRELPAAHESTRIVQPN